MKSTNYFVNDFAELVAKHTLQKVCHFISLKFRDLIARFLQSSTWDRGKGGYNFVSASRYVFFILSSHC
jgi:hypothetical protein